MSMIGFLRDSDGVPIDAELRTRFDGWSIVPVIERNRKHHAAKAAFATGLARVIEERERGADWQATAKARDELIAAIRSGFGPMQRLAESYRGTSGVTNAGVIGGNPAAYGTISAAAKIGEHVEHLVCGAFAIVAGASREAIEHMRIQLAEAEQDRDAHAAAVEVLVAEEARLRQMIGLTPAPARAPIIVEEQPIAPPPPAARPDEPTSGDDLPYGQGFVETASLIAATSDERRLARWAAHSAVSTSPAIKRLGPVVAARRVELARGGPVAAIDLEAASEGLLIKSSDDVEQLAGRSERAITFVLEHADSAALGRWYAAARAEKDPRMTALADAIGIEIERRRGGASYTELAAEKREREAKAKVAR